MGASISLGSSVNGAPAAHSGEAAGTATGPSPKRKKARTLEAPIRELGHAEGPPWCSAAPGCVRGSYRVCPLPRETRGRAGRGDDLGRTIGKGRGGGRGRCRGITFAGEGRPGLQRRQGAQRKATEQNWIPNRQLSLNQLSLSHGQG